MTPREVQVAAEGYAWQQRQVWEREAWKLAHLLSPYSRHPLRPAQFLRPEVSGPAKLAQLDEWLTRAREGRKGTDGDSR